MMKAGAEDEIERSPRRKIPRPFHRRTPEVPGEIAPPSKAIVIQEGRRLEAVAAHEGREADDRLAGAMDIRESKTGEVVVLEPVGRLDTKTSAEFEKKVVGLLNGGEHLFVIDLVDIEYISSAGLRVILMLAKKLNATDGKLVLTSMNEQVREVFDIAGFTSVFTILPTQQDGVQSMANVQTKAQSVTEMAAKLLGIGKTRGTTTASRTPNPHRSATDISAQAAELLGDSDKKKR
jgi:anti-anti-sigma factor